MKTLLLTLTALSQLTLSAQAQNPLTLLNTYTGDQQENANFGGGMTCGDFDGDGREEFVIGASGWNEWTGKNYIYKWDGTGSTEPYLTVQGDTFYVSYDGYDCNLGDINGDGFPDLAIPATGPSLSYDGHLDIFFGCATFDTIPDWSMSENSTSVLSYGLWADSLGDVNGDGGRDFGFVNGYNTDDYSLTRIYFGGDALDSIPDWTIVSGSFIKPVGDVNGDGYCDLLITFYSSSPLLYFGGSPMDTIPDLIFEVGAAGGNGAGVGDVNDDGYDDIAMAMYLPGNELPQDVLYFGGPNIDTVPDVWLFKWNGDSSMSIGKIIKGDFNGDGISDFATTASYAPYEHDAQIFLGNRNFNGRADAFVGSWSSYEFGSNLASGDVDGDGRDELLVQARNYPWFDIGTVYLFHGPETWIDYGVQAVPPEELRHTPGWFQLEQNFPNPFNATTTITFTLGKPSTISLQIYDLKGGQIKQLLNNKPMTPGGYNVSWNGKNETGQPCASGIYLLEMQVDQYREIKKMVLVR
ncbi:MAG: FG-GAP-like repeat-containing protein [bacterium]|nr:FG-GAP-like repeat-containing protein [bacterium]